MDLAACLDERYDLAAILALGELQIAADFGLATIDDVFATGGRGLDDQLVAKLRRNEIPPCIEQLTAGVKVDYLQIARYTPTDDADGVW